MSDKTSLDCVHEASRILHTLRFNISGLCDEVGAILISQSNEIGKIDRKLNELDNILDRAGRLIVSEAMDSAYEANHNMMTAVLAVQGLTEQLEELS